MKIRKRITGTKECPRLSVFRSAKYIYAQLIDDKEGKTLAASSDIKETGTKKERAYKAGKKLAEKAIKHKIKEVVFDRGGFKYQGRVAELARGAREGGLKF
ncbi:MAG: large subunit ribosomal protein L18 [Microgenomates group bacterium Gr01-1014_7]|nr:MAG: large subunit ribosomal protein L18 [Microgenomates group bacterium Gr01-1014_7]